MYRLKDPLSQDPPPRIQRVPFVFGALSPPPSPPRPSKLTLVQPLKKRKFKNVSSLASSLHSSPEQVKKSDEIKSPTKYTPGGSSKSFVALLQVASETLLEQRKRSSLEDCRNRQANSFTPLRADFPEIPELFNMSSASLASNVPTAEMQLEVSEAFAKAMSSILPQVQLEQPKVSFTGLV
jgi:hypothetical protein